jgi:nicotinamidase-related amidase
MAGYCAEYCVLSTYRGAIDLDLNPILLRDALASGSEGKYPFCGTHQ